jgi:hypothetical protein
MEIQREHRDRSGLWMEVDTSTSLLPFDYDGETYWFCAGLPLDFGRSRLSVRTGRRPCRKRPMR